MEGPRNQPSLYLDFLQELLAITPSDHPDHAPLTTALASIGTVVSDVESVVKDKKNFEKLLEIQSSLVVSSFNVTGQEKIISRLASTDRKFLKEGDLKKVCRKSNKTFRFWLFSDYLIYGEGTGGRTYTFHRALEVKTLTVALHSGSTIK